jgi:carbamoyl-phosphate synthase large subunit
MGCPLGQSIYKALRRATVEVECVLADCDPLSAGLLWEGAPRLLPRAAEPAYPEALASVCRGEGVQLVLVGTDAEAERLAPLRAAVEREAGSTVLVNVPEVVAVATDKLQTARFLRERGLPAPASVPGDDPAGIEALCDLYGFPVVVKPRRGASARGVRIVRSPAELRQALPAPTGALIVQEHLGTPEAEFTVGIYCDRAGRPAGGLAMRRQLAFGLTYKAEVDRFPPVLDTAARVAVALGAVGPCNIQCRHTPRGPVPFEVNPRFSSSTGIRAAFGLNEPELAVREYVLGESPRGPWGPARAGHVLRYWEETYLTPEDAARLANLGAAVGAR